MISDGMKKIEWSKRNMPMLRKIAEDFSETKPFAGLTIGVSLHIEKKTAALNTLGMKVYGRRDDSRFSIEGVLGGTEETTSGGFRMREEMDGEIPFPIIVINDETANRMLTSMNCSHS